MRYKIIIILCKICTWPVLLPEHSIKYVVSLLYFVYAKAHLLIKLTEEVACEVIYKNFKASKFQL